MRVVGVGTHHVLLMSEQVMCAVGIRTSCMLVGVRTCYACVLLVSAKVAAPESDSLKATAVMSNTASCMMTMMMSSCPHLENSAPFRSPQSLTLTCEAATDKPTIMLLVIT